MVTALVGPDKARFDLHEGLLCESSDFFKAAFTSNFQERNGTVNLPEQDTRVFKFFVHWLYSGKLTGFYYPKTLKPTLGELSTAVLHELTRLNLEDLESLPLRNPAGRAFNIARYRDVPCSDLIALYILADALQVHNLKDPIVTRIIDVHGFSRSTERDSNDDKEEGKEQEGLEEGEEEEKASQGGKSILEDEDDVIDEITTLFWNLNRPPGFQDPIKGINMAWETLPSMSPLCQVLVRCFCDNVVNVKARTGEQDYYAGFLTAVVHKYALRWVRGDEAWQTTDWIQKRRNL